MDWSTDVDQSGGVGPVDALAVINEMIQPVYSVNGQLPETRTDSAPFLDVDNNATVGPIDALQVLSALGNVFAVQEDAATDTRVGRIVPSSGTGAQAVYEFTKDPTIDTDIRETLALRSDDHYHGATDAPVLIIEYVDFACPSCGLFHTLAQQAMENFDGEVAFVTRHLPLSSHPNARAAAIAAEAAGNQGQFDEMADLLFTRRLTTLWDQAANPTTFFQTFASELGLNMTQFNADLSDADVAARVDGDRSDAISILSLGGTPSFIYNDFQGFPSLTQSSFDQLIQSALNNVETPFKIDRFTGDIRVRDAALLDYEATSSYSFDVMINGATESVQVDLTNVAGA